MDTPLLPKIITVLLASLILMGVGGLGLLIIVTLTLPELFPRWLFFLFLNLGCAGLAMPVIYFIHLRFPSPFPTEMGVLARQSILVGLYMDVIAWLQLGHALNSLLAFFIAIGLIAIEFLLRWRERSLFKSGESADE